MALTMALSAAPSAPDDAIRSSTLVALGSAPDRAVHDAALSALNPPPQTVVLETKSFGTVTVDHKAHLARRASCKGCHGPGPVSKIGRFEPRVAHDRCTGCHKEEKRGPTGCRDCHLVKAAEPAAPATTVTETSSAPAGTEGAGVDEGSASKVALAAAPVPPAETPAPPSTGAAAMAAAAGGSGQLEVGRPRILGDEGARRTGFMRIVGVGYSVVGRPGQDLTTGPAVYLSMREDDVLLVYALERGSSAGGGRTLGLVGAGMTRPIYRAWNANAVLLGGFDAGEGPIGFVPTLGLRVGAEWLGRRTSLALAVTGASDLVRQVTKLGEHIGGVTFSFSASIGYVLNRD
jgi:hypothetical protein